jgi:hypothetical protein
MSGITGHTPGHSRHGAGRRGIQFALAVIVLAGGAIGLKAAKARGLLQVIKGPLPILKSLHDLDKSALSPWRYVSSRRLPEDTIGELGTEEYIEWTLENPTATAPWARTASLFVTYYTGKQDQVPHVPEECYLTQAFSLDSDEELTIAAPMAGEDSLPVRLLRFSPPPNVMIGDSARTYVYYLIAVNGDFYNSRNRVRLRMIDDRETHLYYSKIEVSFRAAGSVDRSEMDALAGKLLGAAITELARSHWPPRGAERTGMTPATDGRPSDAVSREGKKS